MNDLLSTAEKKTIPRKKTTHKSILWIDTDIVITRAWILLLPPSLFHVDLYIFCVQIYVDVWLAFVIKSVAAFWMLILAFIRHESQ